MAIGAQGISYGQTADEYPPAATIELLKDGIKIGFGAHGRFSVFNVTNRSTASTDSVRNSKWQRRDDATSPWVDVPDSEKATGIYGYVVTLPGKYRWIGEVSHNGVWGKYASANILQLTSDGTVTSSLAEVEGVPSDHHKLTLEGHRDDVLAVAFSPDGNALVSGGYVNTILFYGDTLQLWDADTGQPLQTLKGHRYAIASVAFSQDGSLLASGSYDKTIQVWELTPATPVIEPPPPTPTVEPPQLAGDLNADGVVNVQDLVLVASQFGQTGQHAADINEDGVVNIQDLVLVAGAFNTTAN